MTINEKTLAAFRELDSELKAQNTTVLDYENSLDDAEDKPCLTVTRQQRNFLAHVNKPNFTQFTEEQYKFLVEHTRIVKMRNHCAKDEMKRVKLLKCTEPIKNILLAIDKYPVVPIETKLGIYLVDKDILIHQLAIGNKKIAVPTKLPKYNYLAKLDNLDGVSKGTYIVTENGNSTDKYLGILII